MHIKCEKELLLENINLVQRAVSSRTTQPIFECILLKCGEDGLRLYSTDQEIAIKTAAIECEALEYGAVALPSRFFSDIVRKLPGGTVSIEVKEKLVTIVKCMNSEFKIVGMNPEEFPELEDIGREKEIRINQGVFRELVKSTVFSICQDNTKPNLMGALIEMDNSSINMVTCDAFRVSFACGERPDGDTAPEKGVIVPYKAISEMQRLLVKDEEEMSIFLTDRHIMFDIGACTVFSRLIDGEFINYSGIFPEEFTTRVTLARRQFADALDRAALVSYYENKKNPVRLKFSGNDVAVTTNSETGNLFEEFSADIYGDELEIAFNPKFLIDAVKSIEADEITAEFNTPLSPCVIKPVSGEDTRKYLVLPLRLKN